MCRIWKYANSRPNPALQKVQQSTVVTKLIRGPLQKGMITGLINENQQIMKKITLSIAVILSAVCCTKTETFNEVKTSNQGIKLYAHDLNALVSAKTVTNPETYAVNWTDGDSISVFTSVAGQLPGNANDWKIGNPVKFVTNTAEGDNRIFVIDESVKDAAAGKLEAFRERYATSEALDWYVVYPRFMQTPSTPGKSVIFFGKRSDLDMSQHGNDNMDHLALQDVLLGKALNTLEPVVSMQHIGALQQVTVKNTCSEPITVKSITMTTTTAKLSGEFRMHLTEAEPFDPSDAMNSSSEFVLDVTDGTPIASGSSAKFYFVTPPFKVAAGEDVTISITADKGTSVKTMTAQSELSFLSGHRYNANVDFAVDESLAKTVSDVVMNVYKLQAQGCNSGLDLSTGEVIDLYNISAADQARVDVVTVQPGQINFIAPSNNDHFSWLQGTAFTSIPNWTTRNKTSFRKTWLNKDDFNAITKYSEIVKAYDEAATSWTINDVAGNESQNKFNGLKAAQAGYLVIAAKTSDGRYALIFFKAVGAYKGDPEWSNMTITIDVKVKDNTPASQQ